MALRMLVLALCAGLVWHYLPGNEAQAIRAAGEAAWPRVLAVLSDVQALPEPFATLARLLGWAIALLFGLLLLGAVLRASRWLLRQLREALD